MSMKKEYTQEEVAEIAGKYFKQAEVMQKQGNSRAVRILIKAGLQLDRSLGKGTVRKYPSITYFETNFE